MKKMERYFNTKGLIIPEEHFYVRIDDKILQIFELALRGQYFVINKPRQYGKTPVLHLLERFINQSNDYLCISMSFEGLGEVSFKDENVFVQSFLIKMRNTLEYLDEKDLFNYISERRNIKNLLELSMFISDLVKTSEKRIVLLIDEIDSASNNDLFIKFLGMLREKYLLARISKDKRFQSVILAGVHDVKNLKLKMRDESDSAKYNSPWNIAAEFKVKMELEPAGIKDMLEEYKNERKISLNADEISERIFYLT
ncbi:MAG TPA: AAA family ATPase [bacterium]|nr:AAA family ATPase [bacterium]